MTCTPDSAPTALDRYSLQQLVSGMVTHAAWGSQVCSCQTASQDRVRERCLLGRPAKGRFVGTPFLFSLAAR